MYLNDITYVNDVGVSNGLDANPLTIGLPLDIKAANVILGKDCEGSCILVAANTKSEVRRGAWRIVIEADKAG